MQKVISIVSGGCIKLAKMNWYAPANLQSVREKTAMDMAATDGPESSTSPSPSTQTPVGAKRKSTGIRNK